MKHFLRVGLALAFATVPTCAAPAAESIEATAYFNEPIGAESVRLWDAFGAAGWAFINTRDFARFGYVMLRNGAWDRGRGLEQLVRPDLIARCKEWPVFLQNVTDGTSNHNRWFTTNDPPSHFLHTWNV